MTWYDVPSGSTFGPDALPYGIFSTDTGGARVGARIGDRAVDLAAVAAAQEQPFADLLDASSLNPLMAAGAPEWARVRDWVTGLFDDGGPADLVRAHWYDLAAVAMHLPVQVGDYVDFYASERHASNVGAIFRPDSPALPPNWKHLPIGYHGRAGTVVVSGTDVVRPNGQRRPEPGGTPPFGPSERLDIECEVGFLVGRATGVGQPLPLDEAREAVFGVVLVNDWSARDIQAWEYVPLGPFLGKSFATSMSAWVLPTIALHEAVVPLPPQDPEVLPYLSGGPGDVFGLDLRLEVSINGTVVARPEYRSMYWSPTQMLAHMTVNGASLRVGDLYASGTVSGAERDQFGSLLELTWNGADPVRLDDGTTRGFLADGDTVTLSGWAPGPQGQRIGLGECTGTIRPAVPVAGGGRSQPS